MKKAVRFLTVAVLSAGLCGCGGGGVIYYVQATPTRVTITNFRGSLAGLDNQSGLVRATVDSAKASGGQYAATGSVTFLDQTTLDLTGTYDPTTIVLTLAGGGFTFTGTGGKNGLTGTYTAPDGGS